MPKATITVDLGNGESFSIEFDPLTRLETDVGVVDVVDLPSAHRSIVSDRETSIKLTGKMLRK